MNRILQSLFTLILLSVCQPWQVKAQDLMASTDNLSAMINTSPPDGEDKPKKKKKKNALVPGCGEVIGFAQLDVQANTITVKWQHEGDPSKIQYKLEWKNTTTGALNSKIIVPNCSNCVMNEIILNLNASTLYEITINAICDISVDGTAQSSIGTKTLLSITTLNQPCVAVSLVNNTPGYDFIIAQVPSSTTPNVSYVFTLRDATGAFVASHTQPASNGVYMFSGLEPCQNYFVDVLAQCAFGNVVSASAPYTISAKTKCCGEISNITGTSPIAGLLKVNWNSIASSNPDNILVEIFKASTKIDEQVVLGTATTCTFDNLTPDFYTVKVTAHCQCSSANSNCLVVTPFTPIFVNIADPCAIPANLVVQSVKSNEVSFQWIQEPSTKYRKYKLVLYYTKERK